MLSQRNEFNKVLEALEIFSSSYSNNFQGNLEELKELYFKVGQEYIISVHQMDPKEFPEALITYELLGRIINEFCKKYLKDKFEDLISSEELFWWGRMQSRHNSQYLNFNYIMNEYGTEKLLSLSTFDEATKLYSSNEYKSRFKDDLQTIDLKQYVEYVMFCSKAFDIEIDRFLNYLGFNDSNDYDEFSIFGNEFDDSDNNHETYSVNNGNLSIYNLDNAYADQQIKRELELLDMHGLMYQIRNFDETYITSADSFLSRFYQDVQENFGEKNKTIFSSEIALNFMTLTEIGRTLKKYYVLTEYVLNIENEETLQNLRVHIDKQYSGDSEAHKAANFLEKIAASWEELYQEVDIFFENKKSLNANPLDQYEYINPDVCSAIVNRLIDGNIKIGKAEEDWYINIVRKIMNNFIEESETNQDYYDLFTYLRDMFVFYDYIEKFYTASFCVSQQTNINKLMSKEKNFDSIKYVLECYREDFEKIWISEEKKSKNLKLVDGVYYFTNLVVRFWMNLEQQGNNYLSLTGFHDDCLSLKFVRNGATTAGLIVALLFDYMADEKKHSKSNQLFKTDLMDSIETEEPMDALAQFDLGLCYENGDGVAQDYEEAVKWYKKAAEQGHVEAQFNLGLCHENGDGVNQDYEEAANWYRKAAEQGHSDAQNNLGALFVSGDGVAQDYEEAVKWYNKAAEQGHDIAQNNLGLCYALGDGVSQNYSKALRWFIKSVKKENADAQNNIGIACENGFGVVQDYTEAVKWYRKAAEQGHTEAQFNLGECYYNGTGVEQDCEEAIKWYRKAAEQGQEEAQAKLETHFASKDAEDKIILNNLEKASSIDVEEENNHKEYEVGLVGREGFRIGYSKILEMNQKTGELCSDREYLLKIIEIERAIGVIGFASSEIREDVDFILKALSLDINCIDEFSSTEVYKTEIVDYFNTQWKQHGNKLFDKLLRDESKTILSFFIDEKFRSLTYNDIELLFVGRSHKFFSDGGFWSLIYGKIKDDETLLNTCPFDRFGKWEKLYQLISHEGEGKRELLLLILKNDVANLKTLISNDSYRRGSIVKFIKNQDFDYLNQIKEICSNLDSINLIMKSFGIKEDFNGEFYLSNIEGYSERDISLLIKQGDLSLQLSDDELSNNYCNVYFKRMPVGLTIKLYITLEFVFGTLKLYDVEISEDNKFTDIQIDDIKWRADVSRLLILSNSYPKFYLNLIGDSKSISQLRDGLTGMKEEAKPIDIDESYQDTNPNCFVATAVFEDNNHYCVVRLRNFRDSILSKYWLGQKFIDWYYNNGELLADLLKDKNLAKNLIKIFIEIFVRFYDRF
ncbi:tetratricopeptide repeat protein [Fusibacter tunisiensis]|uniref:TPR repeat protein n=1 Tax=Fusibacter tunisiensis TaxID=1008308 RepID=A0ABS2MTH3_9FIRM|nr:tetratricopeptide repeat protein [Fusibacter tunisiensis]MBM7562709.1 TPR repeat protein [Fusibacter tunisiensis]